MPGPGSRTAQVRFPAVRAQLQPVPGRLGGAAELEYGVKGWWTSELYFDGQATGGESGLFTGYPWENRFRILPREHWINPVFYVEFENIDGADKSLLEVVGHDGKDDLTNPNAEARREKKRDFWSRHRCRRASGLRRVETQRSRFLAVGGRADSYVDADNEE